MAILDIICIPKDEERLRQVATPVAAIDDSVKTLISDLLETLRTSERPGVGLAAPQVGASVRLVVIESTGWKNDKDELVGVIPLMVLINPEVVKASEEKEERFEGCLSVPEYNGYVTRPKKVKVSAMDEAGNMKTIKASGFLARILQHEIDHLDGVLFIDHIRDKKKLLSVSAPTDETETEY
jgi:peptide deformylase